jgi:muramoyltetrapeptide carboxypeptidase
VVLGIVSPASRIPAEVLEAGLAVIRGMGFEAKVFPHVLDGWNDMAGRDGDRAADIQAAFADPDVDAVLCSRGGYGCARLVPLLDMEPIFKSAKPFLGFSDVTTLHLAFGLGGVPTFYAPMVGTIGSPRPEWVLRSFTNALAGVLETPVEAPTAKRVVSGRASGVVGGGCLTLLADSLGTPYEFNGRGKIVLIEDVHERPHRLDASLTHLLNAGAFDGVAGFVVGELTGTDELRDEHSPEWRSVVRERLEPIGVPMVFDYPFGHIDAMLTLPLGRRAVLDADAGTLNYVR